METTKIVHIRNAFGAKTTAEWNDEPALLARDCFLNHGSIGLMGRKKVYLTRNGDYGWEKGRTEYTAQPIIWTTEWELKKKQFKELNKCIVALQEGPHKVACCKNGVVVNDRGECLCRQHSNIHNAARDWHRYVRGAK